MIFRNKRHQLWLIRRDLKKFVEDKYEGWNHKYTDGLKSEIGVEAAASTRKRTKFA